MPCLLSAAVVERLRSLTEFGDSRQKETLVQRVQESRAEVASPQGVLCMRILVETMSSHDNLLYNRSLCLSTSALSLHPLCLCDDMAEPRHDKSVPFATPLLPSITDPTLS